MIETERLVLRRWRDADRAPFAELNGDPETLVFFPSTLTRTESDAFIDRIEVSRSLRVANTVSRAVPHCSEARARAAGAT